MNRVPTLCVLDYVEKSFNVEFCGWHFYVKDNVVDSIVCVTIYRDYDERAVMNLN